MSTRAARLTCEFCGAATDHTVCLNDGFTGALCKVCDVIFTDTSHDLSVRARINAEFYSLSERLVIYHKRRRELQSRYTSILRFISTHCSGHLDSVLEVGSNIGAFAELLLKHGLQVETVEVNAELRAYQLHKKGIRCYGSMEEVPRDRLYDAIVFMDVLEHIPRPAQILSGVRSLLREGGVVYLQFPNKNSLIAAIAGQRWTWWSAPDHLYHFSAQGVRRLAQQAGYRCQKVRTASPILDDLSQLPAIGKLAGIVFHLAGRVNVNPLVEHSRGSMLQVVLAPVQAGGSTKSDG